MTTPKAYHKDLYLAHFFSLPTFFLLLVSLQTQTYYIINTLGLKLIYKMNLSKQTPPSITECMRLLKQWFCLNHMQLNTSKTVITKFGTLEQLKAAENLNSINNIPFNSSLKTLGVLLDSKLTFKNHITNLIKTCNYHLHSISQIRAFLNDEIASSLIRCLVRSYMDYCNSVLYGIANLQLKRLQRVVNKGARITFNCNVKNPHLVSSSKNNL